MSSTTVIWKIRVTYFDEQSIMVGDAKGFKYYLPNENTTFVKSNWCEKDKIRFNSTFIELDEDVYLVNKKVARFDIINNISLIGVDSDDESDYDDFNFYLIWEDIKSEISNFDKMGKSELTFLVVVLEHWWQCWEGDWDCNYEYVGVVNNDLDPKLLLTNDAREGKIKRDIEFNRQFENG
jgi:hypothetical protein